MLEVTRGRRDFRAAAGGGDRCPRPRENILFSSGRRSCHPWPALTTIPTPVVPAESTRPRKRCSESHAGERRQSTQSSRRALPKAVVRQYPVQTFKYRSAGRLNVARAQSCGTGVSRHPDQSARRGFWVRPCQKRWPPLTRPSLVRAFRAPVRSRPAAMSCRTKAPADRRGAGS